MLEWLEIHCPQPNHCAKSVYLFQKWFQRFETPLVRHYYCPVCSKKLVTADGACTNCSVFKSFNYIVGIPVIPQLQKMFNRPGFYTSLSHRFSREKNIDNNIEDIYDGSIYRTYLERDSIFDLKCLNNISFTWNSDGIPLFNSSKYGVWPLSLQINELPIKVRNKVDNMILVGLWHGPKKPVANLFMNCFMPQFSKLYRGVSIHVTDIGREIELKALVLGGTLEMPAKALFSNMKQFNGKMRCHKCKIETVKIGNKRVYNSVSNLSQRTTDETLEFAKQASEKKSVFGVKGPTTISKIVPDFIKATKIDGMHLFMGLAEMLLGFWVSPNFHDHPASMSGYTKLINRRLLSMTVPSFVERLPRGTDDFKYWKAWELIIFIAYYSIPVLNDIMKKEYSEHHQL